jgi:Putative Ig domain/Pentapeptide repeats (8 copies)
MRAHCDRGREQCWNFRFPAGSGGGGSSYGPPGTFFLTGFNGISDCSLTASACAAYCPFSICIGNIPLPPGQVIIQYAVPPLSVSTTSLPYGAAGSAYSQPLAAAGGFGPYTWSVTAGSLPAGLSLDSATGVISGTPTAAGTASFTVQATDAENPAQTASQPLSITVIPATCTTLAGCNLHGLNLTGATLPGADLSGANFTGATLTGADLAGADLSGANFNKADLADADLDGATVTGTTNFNKVTWSDTTCPDGTNSNNDGGSCAGHL